MIIISSYNNIKLSEVYRRNGKDIEATFRAFDSVNRAKLSRDFI